MAEKRVPSVGDAVRVRGTAWSVTRIDPAFDRARATQHVVTLRSIGEDDRGASLRLVWETEPARAVLDAFDVPKAQPGRWDDPARLDAFLRAVQWGSVTNADQSVVEAPFRSGIDLKTYQLEPLVRALDMPRAQLLIADDVGLGKTIEAGLVLQEFVLRHRVRNCMIICPASLVSKWQTEMRERFGLEFRVLDTDYEREVARTRGRHVNPLKAYPWLVTSIDWIKRPERAGIIDAAIGGREPDEYPRPFDMLIVDEAHLAAPAGKNHPVDSLRTAVIDRFGAYFEHRLFLTATPHNGHPESFWRLLNLLDRIRFQPDLEPRDADVDRAMVRRLKRHVREVDPSAPFPTRVIHELPTSPTDGETLGYELLDDYLALLKKLNTSGTARSAVRFMAEVLRKRFLSSPAAFSNTLAQHAKTIDARGRNVDDVSDAQLRTAVERAGDTYDDDDSYEEASAVAVETSSSAVRVSDEAMNLLTKLDEWATSHSDIVSGRAAALVDLIEQVCKEDDDTWGNGRLIVFTEYRDTHHWLVDRLGTLGVPPERIASMYGGMDPDRRSAVAELFNREPGDAAAEEGAGADLERTAKCDRRVRVLLATDTASEGIDLQRYCHDLLHFDLPYNPSRMEQRNGRIDRHGQPHPTADIHTFAATGTSALARDTSLEARIAEKLATVASDVGSANALFADDLQQAHQAALVDRDDTALTRYDAKTAETAAKTVVEEGVRKLRARVKQADERLTRSMQRLEATDEAIAQLVQTALALDNQPTLIPVEGRPGEWALPGGGGNVGLRADWTDTIPELVDRLTGVRRTVTFDSAKAGPAPKPILLHLNHAFVAHAAALLRAQLWSRSTTHELYRVAARRYRPSQVDDPNVEPGDVVVVAHARVLITAGTHLEGSVDATVLHEDVVARAARLRNGNWSQIRTDVAADRVWAARTDDIPDDPDAALASWAGVADRLAGNVTERAEEVAIQLADDLKANQQRETEALRADAERIQASLRSRIEEITSALDDDAGRLFSGWSEEELAQKRRNRDVLERRLVTIADDIEAEIAAVEARYDDIDTFAMPIALTFLYPEEAIS